MSMVLAFMLVRMRYSRCIPVAFMRKILYRSTSHDPFFNLALENWLLHDCRQFAPTDNVLLMYQNRPCIVIGRNQNIWLEAHLELAQRGGIPVLRRWSGGGAVYHDSGNINYSLHRAKSAFSRTFAAEMIISALNRKDLFLSSRHDIFQALPDGTAAKVSGSAYKLARERAYHHGTFLVSSDLANLGALLHSPVELSSRPDNAFGVTSVRSMVANVSDLTVGAFVSAVTEAFQPDETFVADGAFIADRIAEYMRELQSWEWMFAKSPACWMHCPKLVGDFYVVDGLVRDVSSGGHAGFIGQRFDPAAFASSYNAGMFITSCS